MSNINVYPSNYVYRLKAKWFASSGLANLTFSRSIFQFWGIDKGGKRVLRFRISRQPLQSALKSGRIEACYKDWQRDLFAPDDHEPAFWLDYNGDETTPRIDQPRVYFFRDNDDFRSQESQNLLAESDIVITNPPFSFFRAYMSQLLRSGEKFLVIGNVNAITCQEIFYAIRDNRLMVHPGETKGHMDFRVPPDYPIATTETYRDEDGNPIIKLCFVRWFTNLSRDELPAPLPLTKRYSPADYPHYDNFDAIDVDETLNIPADYNGVMGVPVSFLDKYNPDQFEIVGMAKTPFNHRKIKTYPRQVQFVQNRDPIIVSKLNDTPAIEIPSGDGYPVYYEVDGKCFILRG